MSCLWNARGGGWAGPGELVDAFSYPQLSCPSICSWAAEKVTMETAWMRTFFPCTAGESGYIPLTFPSYKGAEVGPLLHAHNIKSSK